MHKAVTKDGMHVAMKIQYPGVADSIESDIENVKLLLDYTNLIPEGLYLDRAMKVCIFVESPLCIFHYYHFSLQAHQIYCFGSLSSSLFSFC